MTKWKIYNEDAVEWAKNYQKGKFHALLCDAPYHLTSIVKRFGKKNSAPAKFGTDGVFSRSSKGFMGTQWDGGDLAFRPETWEAFGEVLYPGAFGMAFSASRNWHRMAVAIEDAGFILHPTIFLWAQGQGFPKATNISKQVDKSLGNELKKKEGRWSNRGKGINGRTFKHPTSDEIRLEYEPSSDESRIWEGHRYGLQALKPAVEPIIVFQKPYEGRPLDNIVETGAGAINIDGGRIDFRSKDDMGDPNRFKKAWSNSGSLDGWKRDAHQNYEQPVVGVGGGRWPSNFILDESSALLLDAQTGMQKGGFVRNRTDGARPFENNGKDTGYHTDEVIDEPDGGASRFFYQVSTKLDESDPVYYCGKVSPKERNAGLEEKNNHPTLKPIDLCKYLATLLLPPVEYAPRRIFVPFSGSGSEMIGAGLAGWEHVVGVEFDTENSYVDIAEKRLEHWLKEQK